MNLATRIVLCGIVVCSSAATAFAQGLWLHPKCAPLPTDTLGPFVTLGDGSIFAVDAANALVSRDEGNTWEASPLFATGQEFSVSNERALMRTRSGVLIVAFMNMREEDWRWNSERHDADPGTRLPNYVMRSLDEGKTWTDLQKLHDDWTGCVRNMIQTRDGRVVFTSMRLLNNPGRHAVLTYSSTDDGTTWKASNLIDLGGNGHHDGAGHVRVGIAQQARSDAVVGHVEVVAPVEVPDLAALRAAEVRGPLVRQEHLRALAEQLRSAGNARFRVPVEGAGLALFDHRSAVPVKFVPRTP